MNNISELSELVSEVISAPLGDLIASVGKGVGEAQAALDEMSLKQVLTLYSSNVQDVDNDSRNLLTFLREIGYQPTFYTLPETEVEAHIALSFSVESMMPSNANQISYYPKGVKLYAMPLNASNVNKFSLSGNAFAKIRFKVVPIPPPIEGSQYRTVPDLVKKSLEEAKKLTDSLGLEIKIISGEETIQYNENNARLNVVSQSIVPGKIIKIDEILILYVS